MELELGDVKSRFGEKAGDRGVSHQYSEQQQLSNPLQLEGLQGLI